jgi:hypothetical protein
VIKTSPQLLEDLNAVAKRLHLPIQEAILDPDFYFLLNKKEWQNHQDLCSFAYTGLLNSEQAQLEIRINGRKKRRILLSEILSQELLFPIYDFTIKEVPLKEKGSLLIIENETGLVACHRLLLSKLNLEKLHFTFTDVNTEYENLRFLSELRYDGKILPSAGRDTLVTANYALFFA